MRSVVYETVGRRPVSSVPSFDSRSGEQRVCCWAPRGQEVIDRQRRAPRSNGAAASNTGSVVLTRYDTIRDAILTCVRKPTWIGLIFRTETTTKNCKIEKLNSKSRYVRSNSKSLGNHVVSSKKKKKKGCSGKDLEKKVLSLGWKREWVMKN